MAGNKGAVAIRMEVDSTSICFVTAHLAAGFANYEERNRDYKTISHGLRFQKNRSIEDHRTVIWLGDFNYRIGLGDEKVRKLVANAELEKLYANDQVSHNSPMLRSSTKPTLLAQPPNGRRSHLPILLRGARPLPADIQVRCGHRRLRHIVSPALSSPSPLPSARH